MYCTLFHLHGVDHFIACSGPRCRIYFVHGS